MRKYLPIKVHHIYFGYGWWWGSKVYFRDRIHGGIFIVPMEKETQKMVYAHNGKLIGDGMVMSWEQSRQREAMETKFNFKSQICTSREQSERLIALGLRKETADMCWIPLNDGRCVLGVSTEIRLDTIPAWSLHRLTEMISEEIQTDWESMCLQDKVFTKRDNLYDNIVDCIEWLIKERYFNKDYLCEK